MGATAAGLYGTRGLIVSTHAPVWGRLRSHLPVTGAAKFQLTPPYGGDFPCRKSFTTRQRFQLTPPYGGDLQASTFATWRLVSTHAPVWGRRRRKRRGWKKLPFQLTPPYGGDHAILRSRSLILPFQLTPPYGGDDAGYSIVRVPRTVSTHAPVWGRRGALTPTGAAIVFQLTPPYGGDFYSNCTHSLRLYVSTHAPVWGRRHLK